MSVFLPRREATANHGAATFGPSVFEYRSYLQYDQAGVGWLVAAITLTDGLIPKRREDSF